MKRLFLIGGGLICGLFATVAAEPAAALEQPPLPKGPLLSKPGDFSVWQILYSYTEDKMKSSSPEVAVYPNAPNGAMLPAATRSVTVTRTKPLWLAVTVDVKGNTMNQGGDGTLQILNVSGSPAPIPAPTDLVDSKLVDFSRVDFPDMAWISPKTYVGVQKIGELPCLVFKNADPAGEMTAWVDLESRFPVLWRQGNQTRAFRLLSAPPQPLDFPPQLDKLFKAMKKDREILRRPIPRGG